MGLPGDIRAEKRPAAQKQRPARIPGQKAVIIPAAAPQPEERRWFLDLVTNSIDAEDFPFTVWARLMRRTILEQGTGLLHPTPPQGALALRQAVAAHLRQFRGMDVTPEQIVIGAGTEVLYSLLVQLLGQDRRYAVEDPGYGKIARIYRSNRAAVSFVPLDESGLSVSALRDSRADVVHISPSHHYPTGLVMPIARRQQLLSWAREAPGRCILEDDYDSEFRFVGRPIPTLFSIDGGRHVIYLNTFSKTIAPALRMGYMVLPKRLLPAYESRLGFISCSVPTFDQLVVAELIESGEFSRHINRVRRARRKELFARYGLAEDVAKMYPHELSGGMTRRVLLCCALMDEPRLIVADEPTPGLDLDLAVRALDDFRAFADAGGGVLLITHDIELALRVADRVAVMYAGEIVEEAPVDILFNNPTHPYTQGLIASVPKLGSGVKVLPSIPGSVPDLSMLPKGCRFAERCSRATARCKASMPPLVDAGEGHLVRCFLTGKEAADHE